MTMTELFMKQKSRRITGSSGVVPVNENKLQFQMTKTPEMIR
ncbi:MAG: hypothetical protein PWP08_545 [Methanofollis sp.]|nr:hypothetical protein [Methanofollis sp.]